MHSPTLGLRRPTPGARVDTRGEQTLYQTLDRARTAGTLVEIVTGACRGGMTRGRGRAAWRCSDLMRGP